MSINCDMRDSSYRQTLSIMSIIVRERFALQTNITINEYEIDLFRHNIKKKTEIHEDHMINTYLNCNQFVAIYVRLFFLMYQYSWCNYL